MALPFLETIGLTKKESDIYELLLKEGELPIHTIITKTKLKRGIVYKSLYTLEEKGLATKRDINKKIHFKPESPTALGILADKEIKRIEKAQKDLRTFLPDLVDQYITSVQKPVITEYEGIEGLKKVFEDVYAPKKEPVYGCVELEAADKAIPNYVAKKLIPLRIKNNVVAKSIITHSPTAEKVHAKDNEQLRESVLVDKEDFPLPAEIDVYQDKIALMSFEEGKFVGVIIKNKALATSMSSIFKLAFKNNSATQLPSSSE